MNLSRIRHAGIAAALSLSLVGPAMAQSWPFPGMAIPFPGNGSSIQMSFPGGMRAPYAEQGRYYPSQGGNQLGPVEGYEPMEYSGNPCRIPLERLPMTLVVEDYRYVPITQQAAEPWNRAARQLFGRDFFTVSTEGTGNDIPVKWQSRRLPRGAAGVTQLRKGRGAVQVTGIAVADLNMPQGNLTEILTHELGHALGLDHSEDPRDIMYRSTHNRTLPSGTLVQLTQRDLRMLQWLYTHSRAVPIVAAR